LTRSRAATGGTPGSGPPKPPVKRPRAPDPAKPRTSEAKAHRRRGLRRLAVLLLAVAGATSLGYLLLFSPVLGASSVEVAGTRLLTPGEVRNAAAIPAGHPLLRLDTGAVAERIRQLPPVLDVQVQRSWPTTVVITVSERTPVAFVNAPTGARLLDPAGIAFASVSVPPAGLPKLTSADADSTRAATSVLTVLAEPRRQVVWAELVEVSADHTADIHLELRGGRTVRWGSTDASARKADVLAALLTQPGKVYDVASPDLPTIR
jgi:cell division protein FtsQ